MSYDGKPESPNPTPGRQRRRTLLVRTLAGMSGVLCGTPDVLANEGIYSVYGLEVPPLIVSTPEGPSGAVVEITREAFHRAGLQVSIGITPWSRAFLAVREGQADALIPAVRSPEREAMLEFIDEPLFRSEQCLFERIDRPMPWRGRLEELQDRRFAKLRDALVDPEFDLAVKEGRLRCVLANSYSTAMLLLDAGRADLVAAPKVIGMRILALEGLTQRIRPLSPPMSVQPFHLAFTRQRDLQAVRQKLSAALASMWKEGRIDAVLDAYRQRGWVAPGEVVNWQPTR